MNTQNEVRANLTDLRNAPLGRLAQDGEDPEMMSRLVPGYDAKRVTVAAFQSSI